MFLIETRTGIGSGWLVGQNQILTNRHVVEGSTTVTVRQAENRPFSARVAGYDSQKDIALLQFDPSRATLEPSAAPLKMGQLSGEDIANSLMALGYSGGSVREDGTVGSAAVNIGVLSQIVDFGADGLGVNLVMDAPIDPGDSGGPILNLDGLVVGMSRARAVSTGSGERIVGTFYAVHVDEIRDSLPKLKTGQSR